jgi:hypothetical protein
MVPWMIWNVLAILLAITNGVAHVVAAANSGAPAWYFVSIIVGNGIT